MQKPTIGLSRKLLLLAQGETLPFGQLKGKIVEDMVENGILEITTQGRSRKYVKADQLSKLNNYLSNQLGINNLEQYIYNLEHGENRAQNIIATTDSKATVKRTFKGFLVNSFTEIKAEVNGKPFPIFPQEGTYTYIHDFESFRLAPQVRIIGVENPENFRQISKQASLFSDEPSLFISRYPQSKDLINWLKTIPNNYMHFGDFDFEGIRIFRDEYWKHLGKRASFFIPEQIGELLSTYGNKALYDKQYKTNPKLELSPDLKELIHLFHQHKKCLEQEILTVRS